VPALYATSAAEIEVRRRAFIRKWRLKCKAVADSLEEAGDRLFTFTRLPVSQWKSARTTNAGTPFTGTLGFRTLYWNDGGILRFPVIN
jgi:transposase-like protein